MKSNVRFKQQATEGPFIYRQESASTFTVEKCDGELRSILCRTHVEHLCEEHGGTAEGNARLFAASPALVAALLMVIEDTRTSNVVNRASQMALFKAGCLPEILKADSQGVSK